MSIPLKLQVFEGPMDLLMHLIEKNKIDIYDIPIVTITDQYLEYVRQMEHDDMNVTSEFLVMAATLLDIKSRMLLPREENGEEEEEDPRDELVRRLLEYKLYKYMSEELKEIRQQAGYSYFRPQDLPREVRSYVPPVNYEELIGSKTLDSLQRVFSEVLKRKKNRVDPVRSGFGKIQKEEISVADKELYIRAYLKGHPHADFKDLLEKQDSRQEIIVTFLVILELMKHQKIRISQEETFGRILIDLVEEQDEAAPEPEAETELEEPAEYDEPEAAAAAYEEPAEYNEPEAAAAYEEPAEYNEPEASAAAYEEPAEYDEPEAPAHEEPAHPGEPENAEKPAEGQAEADRRPVKRRLVYRLRSSMMGLGRHAFPISAKRARRDLFRKARGNRIWSRKRHRLRHMRRHLGY